MRLPFMFELRGLSKGNPRWSHLFYQDQPVMLGDAKPLDGGERRQVFDFPGEPDKVIKLLRSRQLSRGRTIRLRIDPDRAYRALVSELEVWRKLEGAADCESSAVARVFGFVKTDKSVGLACEKITAAGGSLAPKLMHALKTEDREKIVRMLNELASFLLRHNVQARDINAANIVLGFNASGREGLYLVDGTGLWRRLHGRRIPLLNRRRLLLEFQRLAAYCKLDWDAEKRRFALR